MALGTSASGVFASGTTDTPPPASAGKAPGVLRIVNPDGTLNMAVIHTLRIRNANGTLPPATAADLATPTLTPAQTMAASPALLKADGVASRG